MANHALREKNEYKPEGYDKRKLNYTIAAVISAIVLATLVTLGITTLAGITGFIELIVVILGALYAGYEMITNVIARKNVEPPVNEGILDPELEYFE